MTAHEQDAGRKVVVGIDGSPSSLGALEWAAQQADMTSAALEVVAAWEWPSTYAGPVPMPEGYDPAAGTQRLLDESVDGIKRHHGTLRITTLAAQGHAAPVLVDASRGADLLVVGSRGHGEFAGMLLGSVSEHCISHAHCPVLVYRRHNK